MASDSNWLSLITTLVAAFSSIAGGGWGGIAAMATAAIGVAFGLMYIAKKVNDGIDRRDIDHAATFPGKEAQDLKKQAKSNDDLLAGLEKQDSKT